MMTAAVRPPSPGLTARGSPKTPPVGTPESVFPVLSPNCPALIWDSKASVKFSVSETETIMAWRKTWALRRSSREMSLERSSCCLIGARTMTWLLSGSAMTETTFGSKAAVTSEPPPDWPKICWNSARIDPRPPPEEPGRKSEVPVCCSPVMMAVMRSATISASEWLRTYSLMMTRWSSVLSSSMRSASCCCWAGVP